MCVYIYIYIYIYIHTTYRCVSLSLSPYVYIYIYTYAHVILQTIKQYKHHPGSSGRTSTCPTSQTQRLAGPQFTHQARGSFTNATTAKLRVENAPNTTTTCVPSFFCPRSRANSEVVVYRALGLYVQ